MKFLLSPLRYFGTMVVGTPSHFSRGAFVMEYCGEVISPTQFEDRKKQYTVEKRRHYYFMSLRSDEVHVHVHSKYIHTCTYIHVSSQR